MPFLKSTGLVATRTRTPVGGTIMTLAYYAPIPVVAGATVATWQGWPSCLAAAAAALSTIGRIQSNETVFRVLLLATTPFWAVHDVMVGSLPGLTADILSMATGVVMLLRRSPTADLPIPAAVRHATLTRAGA